jgi:adenine deaminase
MKDRIIKMGLSTDIIDPFIALAFLALPVIPKLKLTDRGLFDVENFKIISVEHQTKEKI